MNFKATLLLLLFTLSSAMSSSPKESQDSWIDSAPADTAKYFYALGYAQTLNDAKSDALASVSSKISVSVASNFSNSITAKRHNEDEDILYIKKSEVLSQSKNIEYSDVKVLQSSHEEKEWIVLVQVDRSILAAAYTRKLNKIDVKIKTEWDIYQNSNYFTKLKLSSVIKNYLEECDEIFPLLHALDNHYDDSPYTSRYVAYTKEMRNSKNDLVFKIDSDKYSEPLASLIRTSLSAQNATFNNEKYNVLISIATQAKKRKYKSTNESFEALTFALRTAVIKATDKDGNVVSNVVYKTKSGSSEGFEDAIARTQKYEKMIQEKGITAFLVGN